MEFLFEIQWGFPSQVCILFLMPRFVLRTARLLDQTGERSLNWAGAEATWLL